MRNSHRRDQRRREQEYHARRFHGELLDNGFPRHLAPFAALFLAGAKDEAWLHEHLGEANAQAIMDVAPVGSTA